MNNIYEIFRKAQIEANKQKIHANAIVISPGLAYYGQALDWSELSEKNRNH